MSSRGPVVTALVLALLAPAAAVAAAEDPVTGYWTRTQTGLPVPVQPPDPVPEGGSWVSGDPSGPVAVSALRGGADAGNVIVGLRLPVSSSVGVPAVVVCPTTDRWAPEQGGRLEAAPPADCSAPVETRVEEDALVVDLPPALQAAVVDLLLAPADGAAFSLTLERATAQALVQAPETSAEPLPLPPPPPPPPPAPEAGFSGEAGGFDSGFSGPSLDLSGPLPAVDPLLPGPALPAPSAAAAPAPQAAPPAPVTLAGAPPVAVDDRPITLLATALLAVLGALAIRLALQPATAPRRLGGAARLTRAEEPAVRVLDSARGVGRFRAVRTRPPVQI